MKKQIFNIANISCGHCVATIEKELQSIDGVAHVNGNSETKTITVEWKAPASEFQIETRLTEIGYPKAN